MVGFFGLKLLNPQKLHLDPIQIHQNQQLRLDNPHGYSLELGSDVDIQELTLIPGKLLCRGQINVNP